MKIAEKEFYYEDDADRELGIETANYENGGKVKRVKLSDGRVAIVRRCKGKDMKEVEALANGNKLNAIPALIAVSSKVDDKQLTIEEVDELWADDHTKLKMAATTLNF